MEPGGTTHGGTEPGGTLHGRTMPADTLSHEAIAPEDAIAPDEPIAPDEAALARLLTAPRSLGELSALQAALPPPPRDERGGDGEYDDLEEEFRLADTVLARLAEIRRVVRTVRRKIEHGGHASAATLRSFPSGFSQEVGGVRVTLAIERARLTPNSAAVDLFLQLDLGDGTDLLFEASGVPYSREGGFAGEVTLALAADYPLHLVPGKAALVISRTDLSRGVPPDGRGTYVTVSCTEVVAASLDGVLHLSRDWVVPVDTAALALEAAVARQDARAAADPGRARDSSLTNRLAGERVRARFDFDLAGGGFYAEGGFSRPFAFPQRRDVVLAAAAIVVDVSDVRNYGGMIMPAGYRGPHRRRSGRFAETWRGVYLSAIDVDLGAELGRSTAAGDGGGAGADRQPTTRSVSARGLLIDETGLSVHVRATDLLPYGQRRLGNWDYSVDLVELKVLHSSFQDVTVAGKVNLPLLAKKANDCARADGVADSTDAFRYRGSIGRRGFEVALAFDDEYCVPAWRADAITLAPNSWLKFGRDGEGLYGASALHGSMDVRRRGAGTDFGAADLTFADLRVASRAPYFSPGYWGASTVVSAELAGIALSIQEISVTGSTSDTVVKAALNFAIALDAAEGLGLAAEGYVSVLARSDLGGRANAWRFERLLVRALTIEQSTPDFSLRGRLAWYGGEVPDPTWGRGMYGTLAVDVKLKGERVGIGAAAQFGRDVGGRRYFFVDFIADLGPAKIPVFTGLYLKAIGGGYYQNMVRDRARFSLAGAGTGEVDSLARTRPLPTDGSTPPFLGETATGRRLAVSPTKSLGAFLQLVLVGASNDMASIMGGLAFEIVPGVSSLYEIEAAVTFMSEPVLEAELAIEEGLMAYGRLALVSDQDGTRFSANVSLFVDFGDGLLVGNSRSGVRSANSAYVDSRAYAGALEIYLSRDTWYYYLGQPPQAHRLGVTTQVRGVGSVQLGAYLCTGSRVPPLPELPEEVRTLAGLVERGAGMTAAGDGAGFAFGGSVAADFGRQINRKWTFEAEVGLGFDINLRQYGGGDCDARAGDFGIENWYAAGQAYAWLILELKRNGSRKAGLDVVLVLQVEAPNPVWAAGTAAGRIQIGPLKLRFKVSAELGDRC